MRKLSIAIPASVVSDTPHLREKTSKMGLIGRAAAIFNVNNVLIYPDDSHVNQKDVELIARLLRYMETPQYLRKRLFKLSPDLQFAGILPPLRTPHHPLNRKTRDLKIGDFREGVVLSNTKQGALVDIGVEEPALAKKQESVVGKRVTVRVVRTGEPPEVVFATRDEAPVYWGYEVAVSKYSLGKMTKGGDFDLTIATSKYGEPFAKKKELVSEHWRRAKSVLVAFGSPNNGLKEIAAREGLCLENVFDFVVNMVPFQGTETVRTEEALIASLAILNIASTNEA